MEPRIYTMADALAAALAVEVAPGKTNEDEFFDALYQQAKNGKVYAAKYISETLNAKCTEGIRGRLVKFFQEKARLALLAVAMLKQVRKGSVSYARLIVRQFPDVDEALGGIYDFLRINRADFASQEPLRSVAA